MEREDQEESESVMRRVVLVDECNVILLVLRIKSRQSDLPC